MITLDTVTHLIQNYGLGLLFVLAIIEGPIVTVIGAYVAALDAFNIFVVYVVLVLADLVGDLLYYGIGHTGARWIPSRWQARLGLNDKRLGDLQKHFDGHGGKTLVFGKLTHSAGLVILVAAGASRMPLGRFLVFNLIGTLPKTLLFMIIGYSLGYAYQTIDSYIFRASLVGGGLIVLAGVIWFLRKWRKPE